MVPLFRSTLKALENVPIRATTDRTGKPVRIDNLDEAKAAMRNMLSNIAGPFKDKPQVLAVLTQMLNGLIEVDADKAAEAYIDDMPLLAKAQNTGMKLHEIRRSSRAVDNPLGAAALKSSDVFEMTEADGATGKRVFVNTTSYDVASMKDFMQSMTKKLMTAAGNNVKAAEIDSLVKPMVLTLDDRAVFEVEDGMTRKVTGKTITTVRAMGGHNLQKAEEKIITVTRAP